MADPSFYDYLSRSGLYDLGGNDTTGLLTDGLYRLSDSPSVMESSPFRLDTSGPMDTSFPTSPSGGGGGMTTSQILGLLAGLGPTALGVAGIGQQMFGGDRTATSTIDRNVAPASAQEQALLQQALGSLGQGSALAGDLGGTLADRMPGANQAYNSALGTFQTAARQSDEFGTALAPLLARLPGLGGQQAGTLSSLADMTAGPMAPTSDYLSYLQRTGLGRDYAPDSPVAQREYAANNAQPRDPYARTGQSSLTPNNALLSGAANGVGALSGPALAQTAPLMDRQMALTDPASQYRIDPALMSALNSQALGAAQGNLPALNDTLRGQIGQVYEGRLQDVNRFVDTGLRDALDRARQMGFAGGMEVFREGAPGALVDRTMSEAVRQRGTLAGQQAQDELSLAQALPLLGSRLASEGANIGFSQNAQNRGLADTLGQLLSQRLAIPQLASGLESQRVGANATATNALSGAAGAFNTPISTGIAGGTNLINLNQQLARSLGDFGNAPVSQGVGLVGSMTGAGGAAGQIGNMLQSGRLGSAGQTQTSAQPFSLLDAFAPTASLLGGTGGLLAGLGSFQNPGSNTNATLAKLLGGTI